jgi:hypothetical protein
MARNPAANPSADNSHKIAAGSPAACSTSPPIRVATRNRRAASAAAATPL